MSETVEQLLGMAEWSEAKGGTVEAGQLRRAAAEITRLSEEVRLLKDGHAAFVAASEAARERLADAVKISLSLLKEASKFYCPGTDAEAKLKEIRAALASAPEPAQTARDEENKSLRDALTVARRYVDAVAVNTQDRKKRNNYLDCLVIIDRALESSQDQQRGEG